MGRRLHSRRVLIGVIISLIVAKTPIAVTRNVWRFDALGDLDLAVKNLYIADVASGDVTQLTDTPTIDGSVQWSPDGTRILYTAIMHPDTFQDVFSRISHHRYGW